VKPTTKTKAKRPRKKRKNKDEVLRDLREIGVHLASNEETRAAKQGLTRRKNNAGKLCFAFAQLTGGTVADRTRRLAEAYGVSAVSMRRELTRARKVWIDRFGIWPLSPGRRGRPPKKG
jgi:hypothetical protein